MRFPEKSALCKTSANISLFCNILDASLAVEEFDTLQQVIHIPSTHNQTLSWWGFTEVSPQTHTKPFRTRNTVITYS